MHPNVGHLKRFCCESEFLRLANLHGFTNLARCGSGLHTPLGKASFGESTELAVAALSPDDQFRCACKFEYRVGRSKI